MVYGEVVLTDWYEVNYSIPFDWVSLKIKQEREITAWCKKNFPDGNYQVGAWSVFFKNEKDALWFSLRWS